MKSLQETLKYCGWTYIVRLFTTILAAQVGVVAVTIRVAILEPSQSWKSVNMQSRSGCLAITFIKSSGSKVQAEVWLSADNLAPFHEFIGTKLVGFSAYPSKLRPKFTLADDVIGDYSLALPSRPVLSRANAIQPMVCSDKVATGISNYRHIEVFESINDIFAEAVLV